MNELFPYQIKGVEWLKTKKLALLADEMGLGKSAQAISAADQINANRILVLCPAVARNNWLREFKKFSTVQRDFSLVFSKSHKSNFSDSIGISYDLASHFGAGYFGQFDLLILDEAHYLKSITTKRTRSVFGKAGYVRQAKRIWALTGTPAPNHAGELWPLLYTFGFVAETYDRFVETYCTYLDTSFGRQITGTRSDNTPKLKAILDKVMLRRKTSEVLKDLPKLFITDLAIDPEENKFDIDFMQDPRFERERRILEDTFGHLDMTSDAAFQALEGLAGSLATIRRYVGLKKAGPAATLVIDELENNAYDKIVIFAIHTHVVSELEEKLKAFNPVTLTGSTPPDERQINIDEFQTNPKCRVFIGNIHAAGTAITLTASNQVLFVEQDWVPGNNAQALKRCHRIGQTKPVFVRIAGLAGSFDEQVAAILSRKARELFELFDKNNSTQSIDPNMFLNSNDNS